MLGVSGLTGSPGDGSSEAGAASSSVPAEETAGGTNRWPRQETIALLKIRSDMEAAFRESSLKGPLWDEISRKLGELGYRRSSKKCREKFENVYKYHKRTKDGRATKSDGKTYRFFDQLEAFASATPPPPPAAGSPNPVSIAPPAHTSIIQPDFPGSSTTSTSSDEEEDGRRRNRKWEDFFERMTKDAIRKQEDLQREFLGALERRERDRAAREAAWRAQESARLSRERDLRAHERSAAVARDAAVISFLQKVTEQQPNLKIPPPPSPTKMSSDSGENSLASRWPKAEVEALIDLRTNLDLKYLDSGPKGPLWEEISSAMERIGYSRSSKRCKEKWENINKYYKKVKESEKRRPEDSKTCPYFHRLDALYRDNKPIRKEAVSISFGPNVGSIMARPEQQWPHDSEMPDHEDEDEDTEEEEEEGGGFEIVANKQESLVMSGGPIGG